MDPYIRDVALDQDGIAIHHRGVVPSLPGLNFLGLRFQHPLVSQDLYGVGKDAQYIADQIAARLSTAGTRMPGRKMPDYRFINKSNHL